MTDWLSSTWEANWRSFQYFNLYRLVLALLFWLAVLFPHEWTARLNLLPNAFTFGLNTAYMLAVVSGLLFSLHWQHRFNAQLTLQVCVDVTMVAALLYLTGGVKSGVSILLVVSLAAASLVGRGRLVLFYAALATVAMLLVQTVGILNGIFEESSIVQAGLISAGFFATAILARLLGQRVMINEDLARRRGEALDNQIRISQQVVERMQDGVLIVATDGTVLRSNPVAQEMLGDLGQTAARFEALGEALASWQTVRREDPCLIRAQDGRELEARFVPTTSSDGEILVFLEDIGRVKEQAQQLKLASLGRLTASIAHEIRNPLSAISHAGELLREERRGDMQDRLLRILNDNILRLDRIVQDVLQLGRQNRALPERVVLDEFCAGFVEHFNAGEALADDVVTLIVPAGLSLCFDRAHLNQVLWNLLGNAVRHSSRSPSAVRLECRAAQSEGRVELHVMDDGPGIAESVREQIFEPFFTTHHQGTGLGLYIARELCHANGASLEVTASESGAHFVVAGRNDTCH